MAITKSAITGYAPLPTGEKPLSGELIFTLNRSDFEGDK